MPGGQAHRRQQSVDRRARRLVQRASARGRRHDCPPGGDERRGSALHPLHLRLHRPAQGRGAHHRRLPRLRLDDAPICLRLPRGRRLLVHRRCRLGHRPQLHRLRPAGERRDHADVRRRADLSRCGPLLGGVRKAQGQPVLHRPHRDPRADGPGQRVRDEIRPLQPESCWAPWASRSTPRPGTGTTTSSARAAAPSSTPGGRPRPAAT
jgi:hypothetical protein